jgi:ubiquitin carboxyl-terminal hydrolase 10
VLIEVLLPVLVIRLKRFQYDSAACGVDKISKPIKFTSELKSHLVQCVLFSLAVADSDDFWCSVGLDMMASTAQESTQRSRYTLYGVLCHHGISTSDGPYTVYVLHPNRNDGSGEGWLHIDDESVSAMRNEAFLGRMTTSRRTIGVFVCFFIAPQR